MKAFCLALISGGLLLIHTEAALAALPENTVTSPAGMLPDRYLQCILGRSTNIDPGKLQTAADIISEGRHQFTLRLPPIPAHVGEPPDPTDPAEPVDPRTRVVADPDGLMKGIAPVFTRVVDLWPQRVEMISEIASSAWLHMIIVAPIDPEKRRARVFMTRVKDAASFDLQNIYQGDCIIGDRPARTAGR